MSPTKTAVTTCEIYNQALKYARDVCVPPNTPQPCYTHEWLPENIAALERYREWLSGGGTSAYVIRIIHIPMAGHILSLNHKPTTSLDLDNDLQKGMDYILAKRHGPFWTKNCRNSMLKFRRFLLHERGLVESKIRPFNPALHSEGLPDWLVEQLTRYQHIKQRNWREARIEEGIRRFWSSHLRVWRFLVECHSVHELNDVQRPFFSGYVDWRLEAGASVKSVNGDLRTFHGFMDFLQSQGWPVPHALLRLRCLKEPEPLPRFLTDTQVCALRDDLEQRVVAADNAAHRRDALLDRPVSTCSGRAGCGAARWKICAWRIWTWTGSGSPYGGARARLTAPFFSPIPRSARCGLSYLCAVLVPPTTFSFTAIRLCPKTSSTGG